MGLPTQTSSRSQAALAQAKRASTPIVKEFSQSDVAAFGMEQLRLEGLLVSEPPANIALGAETLPALPTVVLPELDSKRDERASQVL
jgi:hypothetical protein